MTIRDLIRACQVELRDCDVTPDRARELLVKLTAMLGNVNDEIRKADALYADVLLKHLETEEAANRAKVKAECSPEFQRKREARDTKELAIELIRSLKYVLRSVEEEMRLAGRA